jgi:hypothetical protein
MYTIQQPDPNYVVKALWTLKGVDGQYSAEVNGFSVFDSQQQSGFIPYNELTNDIVVGWVQSQLGEQGVANWQATVQGQINSKINPPVVPQPTLLPWE